MKSSNIGGQAVLEGIMMRHGDLYSVAVRKPDRTIALDVQHYKSIAPSPALLRIPFVRGIFAFLDSLILGIRTLMYSSSFFDEEEETSGGEKTGANQPAADGQKQEKRFAEESGQTEHNSKEERERDERKRERQEKAMMYGTLAFSVVFAVAIFMLVPYLLTGLLGKLTNTAWVLSLAEALIRVGIFLLYLILISRMKDIQRTFMYHGAEHKCINCVEHGFPLTVENVLKSSRFHKRCGTSFLFFVIIISAVLLMFVQVKSRPLGILLRILLVPVIAGISYEIIRLAGQSESRAVRFLSKPGLALQRLTTSEPDAEMAEVAITAVEAVFDWREYLRENFEVSESE